MKVMKMPPPPASDHGDSITQMGDQESAAIHFSSNSGIQMNLRRMALTYLNPGRNQAPVVPVQL